MVCCLQCSTALYRPLKLSCRLNAWLFLNTGWLSTNAVTQRVFHIYESLGTSWMTISENKLQYLGNTYSEGSFGLCTKIICPFHFGRDFMIAVELVWQVWLCHSGNDLRTAWWWLVVVWLFIWLFFFLFLSGHIMGTTLAFKPKCKHNSCVCIPSTHSHRVSGLKDNYVELL